MDQNGIVGIILGRYLCIYRKKRHKKILKKLKKLLTKKELFVNINKSKRERQKQIAKDLRKCRNWQTSKTKDLVTIAVVWVRFPSSAF